MKKDKNRKLRGSVLLTVVFVMSILIIFLFGTLTLALAANNRAHVNYSSAQTGITARAVVDSAIKAIENNSENGKAYSKAVGDLTAGNEIHVVAQLAGDGVGSFGEIEDVVISHAGTKDYYIYDTVNGINKWEKGDLLKFTATVNMAGVRTQASAYVLKFKQLDNAGGGGGGAGFVTTADAIFSTQTSLFGGAYLNLPEAAKAQLYSYEDDYLTRRKSRTFTNDAGTDYAAGYQRVYLKNTGAVVETDLFVNNDLYVENWRGFVFPTKGKGMTILGDFMFHNNAVSDSYCNYYYNDEITHNKFNVASPIDFKDIPYLYVDGKIAGFEGNGAVKLGNKDFPMNTFCAYLDCTQADKSVIETNLYCMDSNQTSVIRGQNGADMLYNWSSSVVNRVDTKDGIVKGEICTKGDLTLEKVTINGSVRVEGDLTVKLGPNGGDKVVINGDVVVGGKLIIDGDKNKFEVNGTIYNNETTGGTEVKNLVGYYYVYTPRTSDENSNVYVGLHGNPLTDEFFDNGEPIYADVNPKDLKIYYTLEYGYKQNDPESEKHINNTAGYFYEGNEELSKYLAKAEDVEPGQKGYYIETSLVPFDPGKHPGKDPGDVKPGEAKPNDQFVRIDGTAYERVPGAVKVEESTFTFSAGGGASTYASIDEYKTKYGTTTIYPKYAERKVLLGLDDTVDKSQTKVVKTAYEVVTEIIDPYDETLKATQAALAVLNQPTVPTIINNYDQLYTEVGLGKCLVASSGGEYKVSTGDYDLADLGSNTADNVGEYITKSCILENFTFRGGPVVFYPGTGDMYIGMKNVEFDASADIYIDDRDGGTVYFYVWDDKKLELKGNNCTATYWNALADNSYLSYNSTITTLDGKDYKKIEEFGDRACPRFFIYGGANSTMKISSGSSITTANIISSNMTADIHAGNNKVIDGLLYDNHDVEKHTPNNYILGCCNVKNGVSANTVCVAYIPSDGIKTPVIGDAGRIWWYDTLYYSEF